MRPWWPVIAVDAILERVDAGTLLEQLWTEERPEAHSGTLQRWAGTPPGPRLPGETLPRPSAVRRQIGSAK
jgi:hypothetical protein